MNPKNARFRYAATLLLLLFAGAMSSALAQGTAFSYQGRLQDSGANANGSYDFQFTLWDSLSGGTQQPQPSPLTVTRTSVAVANGTFTVQLDFGASAFPGADRFLEMSVRLSGGGAFTLLSPRQPISSTPYAIRTLSATTADALSSACVGCVQDSQINSVAGNKMSGAIPVASVPGGSGNYIQNNPPSTQSSSSFNISGNGIVGGSLGIGTGAPSAALEVRRNSTVASDWQTGQLRISGASDPNMQLNLGYDTSSNVGVIQTGKANTAYTDLFLNPFGGNVTIGANSAFFSSKLFTLAGDYQDGVVGIATNAEGVRGGATTGDGVFGTSVSGAGVFGTSDKFGVVGKTNSESTNFDAAYVGKAGVWGNSRLSVGVYGTSDSNVGVAGVSENSRGIYGRSITDYAGYFDGPVFISGNIVNPSDIRLKKGVSNLGYGLREVLRLRPVTWRWKDRPDRGVQLGLIAQEVETVLPELVATDKDAEQTKGLNYIGLVPVTIKAIQEQQAQIEQQQELIKQQEAEFKKQRAILASQKQQIEALKKLVCRTHSRAAVCR